MSRNEVWEGRATAAEQGGIDAQLIRRRREVAEAWGTGDEVVLIGAGDPISVPGRGDITYPFRAHSEYYYLTDRNRPGGVLAFDAQEGWLDFVAPVTESDRLWSGVPVGEDEGLPMSGFTDWLATSTRPIASLGASVPGVPCDAQRSAERRFGLSAVRRVKDPVELERMRTAERATSAAFAAVVPLLEKGNTERAVQIELEATAFRRGADAMAFDTIVGSGTNSAVLHFPPSPRTLRTGELVLIDAGAEVRGYASDITRTYAVGGELDTAQAEIYSLVHAAQRAAIERCVAGTEWTDVHLTASGVIARGLVDLGVLKGDPSALIESGAVGLFFPHGVGHLLGLGARDAGGTLQDRSTSPRFPHLRIDLPLRPGFVVTVEPGIYFVPALLEDPERRSRHRGEVAWDRVDQLLKFGGIRIEDDLLITSDGHEVLTQDVPVLD
ncbi:MAG: aminopeptidase P N-terminal domain-containing protein [Solirubrobacteraceae bacterium]